MNYTTYLQNPTEQLFEKLPPELQSVFRILRLHGHKPEIVCCNETTWCVELWINDYTVVSVYKDVSDDLNVYAVGTECAYSDDDIRAMSWDTVMWAYFRSDINCVEYIEKQIRNMDARPQWSII